MRRATLLIRSFTTGLVCRRVVSRSRTRTMPRTRTRRGRAATTSTSRTVDYETPRGPPSRRIDVNQTVHPTEPAATPTRLVRPARPGEPGRNAEESNLVSAARPLCVPVPCRVYERAGSGCRAAARPVARGAAPVRGGNRKLPARRYKWRVRTVKRRVLTVALCIGMVRSPKASLS